MIDLIFDRLLDHYGVSTLQELAPHMGVTAGALSNWKRRQSIVPIKKKCRELGIFEDIFDDETQKLLLQLENNYGNNAQNVYGSQSQSATANSVDPATMALFLEQYQKAEKEGRIKEFRLHIMEFAGE